MDTYGYPAIDLITQQTVIFGYLAFGLLRQIPDCYGLRPIGVLKMAFIFFILAIGGLKSAFMAALIMAMAMAGLVLLAEDGTKDIFVIILLL